MPNPNDAMDDLIDRLGLRGDKETASPTPVRRPRSLCDSRWRIISASLRESPEGVLSIYLKLPATKLMDITMGIAFTLNPSDTAALPTAVVEYLQGLLEFLKKELSASRAPSIFLCIPVEEIERDLISLEVIAGPSEANPVREFITAVEAGLRNDPNVDWVARCGGPAYNANPDPQVGDK